MSGRIIISDYGAKSIASYDRASGSVLAQTSIDEIIKLAVSPDGTKLALAANYNGVIIVDSNTLSIETTINVGGEAGCVAYSPNGKFIAAGHLKSGDIVSIDSASMRVVTKATMHAGAVWTVAFSPSSGLLVSGSTDMKVIISTIPSLAKVKVLEGHTDRVRAAIFISETTVVSGSCDKTIRVWDVRSGKSIEKITKHKDRVLCLALSPDHMLLATGSNDKKLCIFDTAKYKLLHTVECANWVLAIAFADNNTVIAGVNQSQCIAVNVRTGKVVMKYAQHMDTTGIAVILPPTPIVRSVYSHIVSNSNPIQAPVKALETLFVKIEPKSELYEIKATPVVAKEAAPVIPSNAVM